MFEAIDVDIDVKDIEMDADGEPLAKKSKKAVSKEKLLKRDLGMVESTKVTDSFIKNADFQRFSTKLDHFYPLPSQLMRNFIFLYFIKTVLFSDPTTKKKTK